MHVFNSATCGNVLFSYFLNHTLEPEQQVVAITYGGRQSPTWVSTITWFYCKSLAFNQGTALVFRFQHVEGETKTQPLQDSSARVMEGESVVKEGQAYV